MSIKRTFNGATIIKAGAYSNVKVQNLTGFPLQPTGIVGIIGEAVGGEPGVLDILESTQIQAAKARYKSGPIADALGLVVEPSNDPRVANGASRIVVYKTNQSTKAELAFRNNLDTADIVKMYSKNWGADENNLNVVCSEGTVEDSHAKMTGTIDGPFSLSSGETLILTINGTDYTFTNTLSGSKTAAELATEMNTDAKWSGSNRPITASASGDKLEFVIDTAILTDAPLDYGYIVVDPSSTLDTVIGVSGSTRGQKGSRFLTFVKGSETEDALQELGGPVVMSVKYVGSGTTCKLTIQDTGGDRILSTDCAGAASDNINHTLGTTENGELKPKMTVKELVDLINAHSAYEASTSYENPDVNAIQLDFYTDLYVENVAGELKRDVYDMVDYVTTYSQLADAEKQSNAIGAVATFSTEQFFTGGSDGSSSNSDWSTGFDAMKLERINLIVPLLSEDKGSVSIDSINALAKSHCVAMTSTSGRSERQAFVSKLGSKTEFKDAAKALASGLVSIVGQDVQVYSYSESKLMFMDPWAYACICAGMQAGSPVGEPITHKLINVNDIRVRDGSWDPKVDYAELIDAGCTIAEPLDKAGFRTMLHNTTYGKDANFVWNRGSVVEAGYYVAYDLRYNLEAVFTGTKAKTGTAENVANFIRKRMEVYLDEDIIVGDDLNDGLGYKNLKVKIEGNTAKIDIIVTPVQGVDFILATIYLADIRQSA